MKKIYLLFGMALLLSCLIQSSFAQQMNPANATWPLTDPALLGGTGLTTTTSGQIVAADELLSNLEINQYSGPGSSQRLRIAGNAWPANQTDTIAGVYVQFAVAPNENNKLHVSNLSFSIAAASIGTMKASVYYSTDPSFKTAQLLPYSTGLANNYLSSTELTHVSTSVAEVVNNGETFYLRIYPWVEDPAVRTGKYVTLQNIVIEGQTEALAVPASVLWNNDQSFSATGAIVPEAPTYSPAMKYYGKTNPLPISGTDETVEAAAIQTVSQDWVAEPDTVENLYFQYAVSPKFGATFNVESVSMYIGGWFSSNLRAAIYYSQDPSFASSTLLFPDQALVGNAVAPISAELSETVASGETFYLRIYPYNTATEGWAKLVAVHALTISGSATGVTVDPPTVSTASSVSNISTTFASSGGNIASDGGSPVSERGVVWSTSELPTTSDSKTSDGSGSGAFTSELTGLRAGTTYYIRAYATNAASTAYGEQQSFTTLSTLAVPTVSTASIANIRDKSAEGGGNVTEWGGAEVTARGIVWNTSGTPTLEDNVTKDGEGLGSFNSFLYGLTQNTTYYVRAYATNSEGTAYGSQLSFTTKAQDPDVTVIVDKNGGGHYTTVQAAFDAVPDYYTGKYTIYVKPGTYYEKLILQRNKVNVILRGDDPKTTILTYDDYAGKNNIGTSGSYSVAIEPDDFTAVNITFQNTVVNDGSVGNQQAVALRTNGDRQAYYNCHILGYQDTYYAWGGRVVGRIYMKDCLIEGSVDFIFGRDIVVFDNCTINVNRNGGMVTAASTEENTKHGFVFLNSTVTADEVDFNGTAITSFHLGRPWQASPRTVFMNSELPASLNPEGWRTWNATPALYGEYNNSGPGADVSQRIAISRLLTAEEAAAHTVANIFAKETHPDFSFDWMVSETAPDGFVPPPPVTFDLSTDVFGEGSVSPAAGSYSSGENVAITATPASGWEFIGWSGDAKGTTNPLTITMDGNKKITAMFSDGTFPQPDNSMVGYATVPGEAFETTTGGEGGEIITISTLEELQAWVASRENNSTPEIVHIVGKIEAASTTPLTIKYGANVSILGVGSDAELKNVGLGFRSYKNIIVRNLKIHEVFYPYDALTIDDCEHVWIDHNELHSIIGPGITLDTYDGLLDIKNGSRYVTVSWNYIHDHMKTILIGHSDNASQETTDREIRVTFHHNFIENTDGRNPSLRWGAVHMFNNYFKDLTDYGIAVRQGAHALLENNVYENVKIPVTTNKFTGEGYACERGNWFTGTSGANSITQTDCEWWNESTLPYPYTLEPVALVTSIVPANVGVGKIAVTPPVVTYQLTSTIVGEGSVSPAEGTFAEGDTLIITATAAEGWKFDSWSGAGSGTTEALSVVMDADKEVVANFSRIEYSLTASANGEGSAGISEGPYYAGTTATLTANPAAGWKFDGWSGDAAGTENPLSIVMDRDKAITAHFSRIEYALTVKVVGEGSVSYDARPYYAGEDAALTALAASGHEFTGWSGDAFGTDNPLLVRMDGNKTITANFSKKGNKGGNNPEAVVLVYPNPITTQVTFELSLVKKSRVKIRILDPQGNLYAVVANQQYNAGTNKIAYVNESMQAGMYSYLVEIGKEGISGKLQVE